MQSELASWPTLTTVVQLGGGLVSCPEGTSHLTVLPRAAKRSDFVESSPVVTPVPTQDVLEHPVGSW